MVHHCELVHILLIVQELGLESLFPIGKISFQDFDLTLSLFQLALHLINKLIFVTHILLDDLFFLFQFISFLLDESFNLGVKFDFALA